MADYYDENRYFGVSFHDMIKIVKLCKGEVEMCQMVMDANEKRCYVTKVMVELGMPAHLRGYHYLREAICLSVDNMELVGSITKLLYPEIAKTYHTTGEKVERAIRSVIEIGWERGNEALFEEIFGYSRLQGKNRPTNSEFVLGVADKVHWSFAKEEMEIQD